MANYDLQAVLTDDFHHLQAMSAGGLKPSADAKYSSGYTFRIAKFALAYSTAFVDTSISPNGILAPATTLTSLPNVVPTIVTLEPECTYDAQNGRLLVRCIVPQNAVNDGEAHQYNCVGLYDDYDNLLAVLAQLPRYLTDQDTETIETAIFNQLAP